jgi:hypothetical protein
MHQFDADISFDRTETTPFQGIVSDRWSVNGNRTAVISWQSWPTPWPRERKEGTRSSPQTKSPVRARGGTDPREEIIESTQFIRSRRNRCRRAG